MFNYDNLTVNIYQVTIEEPGKRIDFNKVLRTSNPVVIEWLSDITEKPIYPISLAMTLDTVMFNKNSEFYQDFSIIKELEIAKDNEDLVIPNKLYTFDTDVIERLDIKLKDNIVGLGNLIGYDIEHSYHEFTLAENYLGNDYDTGYICSEVKEYFKSKDIDIDKDYDGNKQSVTDLMDCIEDNLLSLEETDLGNGIIIVHLEEVKEE